MGRSPGASPSASTPCCDSRRRLEWRRVPARARRAARASTRSEWGRTSCRSPGRIPVRRGRGDRQREAIVAAVRELLQERSFADLSVSTISERAGVARSGFYFYFDSKYAVLAVILADASELLDELTHHFAPREPGETPEAFAKRMVGSAAAVYANDDPVLTACAVARNTDAQIREMMDDFYDSVIEKLIALLEQDPDARPISDDVPALVRTMAAVTTM